MKQVLNITQSLSFMVLCLSTILILGWEVPTHEEQMGIYQKGGEVLIYSWVISVVLFVSTILINKK